VASPILFAIYVPIKVTRNVRFVPYGDAMARTIDKANQFFERYSAALLARDETAMAEMYAIPSLILFPGSSIPVSDTSQTEEFFASSWEQYEGVDTVDSQITVMAEAPGSVWADVTWSFEGQPRERFCYQLIEGTDGYQIAVLTPMELDTAMTFER
jgi:hypothetical protein